MGQNVHDTAVIFVTDNGYLGPSLQAAFQLTAQGVDALADILIYTVGIDPALVDTLQNRAGTAISFVPLPRHVLSAAGWRSICEEPCAGHRFGAARDSRPFAVAVSQHRLSRW